MITRSITVPEAKGVGYTIGSLEAPVYGETPATYTVTGGTGSSSFSVGLNDGVVEITSPAYTDCTLLVTRVSLAGTEDFTVNVSVLSILVGSSSYVYVDPVNGSNDKQGTMLDPLSSLDLAVERIHAGGTILLYSGFYGSRAMADKPCVVKGLKGCLAYFSDFEISNGNSLVLDSITCTGSGVSIQNAGIGRTGSAIVRKCAFTGTGGITVSRYRYVSLLQNTISSSDLGMSVVRAEEASIVSNLVYGSATAVSITDVDRFSFFHNTVDNSDYSFFDDEAANTGLQMVYVTITAQMLSEKKFTLPGDGLMYDSYGNPMVALNLTDGSAQCYATDFIMSDMDVTWSGLGMEVDLILGEILRVQYLTYALGGYAQIDSNNLTNIANLHFSSGSQALFTYNNSFGTTSNLTPGASNISLDPLYTNTVIGDYSIGELSPNRGAANPGALAYLNNNSPDQNNKDIVGVDRAYKGYTADIGAYENLAGIRMHTDTPYYIGQQGYDEVYSGNADKPLRRLSAGMSDAAGTPVLLEAGPVTTGVSTRKMYLDEASVPLEASTLNFVDAQISTSYLSRKDSVIAQPFDALNLSGTSVYVSMYGDDTNPGTESLPYRTIDAALASTADNLIVQAGDYPLFTGVTNKHIVLLPRNDFYVQSPFVEAELSLGAWNVVLSTNSSHAFLPDSFVVTHP